MPKISRAASGLVFVLVLAACGGATSEVEVSEPVSVLQRQSIADVVGQELMANRVVALNCIPSRTDPVGVWLAMRVLEATVADDAFTLVIEPTTARFGSHPSGCRDPEILVPQSVFLLQGEDDTVLASRTSLRGDATVLTFELEGRAPTDLQVVMLPTIRFLAGNGEPRTNIFGLIDRYALTS